MASGVPPRLATAHSSVTASDGTLSIASSPTATSVDFSIDSDQQGADGLNSRNQAHSRRQSPFVNPTHRALMGGGADYQRSSSPLKRRASSMDEQETVVAETGTDDVDMIPSQTVQDGGSANGEAGNGSSADGAGATHNISINSEKAIEQGLPIRTGNHNQLPEPNNAKPSQAHRTTDAPPLAQQIKTIETLLKAFDEKRLDEGDVAYLVSRQWLDKAMTLGKTGSNTDLGKVDNSDIIEATIRDAQGSKFVKLKAGYSTEQIVLFPQDAWEMLVEWHGLADGQIPITRTAHATSQDAHGLPVVQFEFHPPVFTIHRVWSAHSPIAIEQGLKSQNPPPPVLVRSTASRYHDLLKDIKASTQVPLDRKVRVWKVLQSIPTNNTSDQRPGGLSTPPGSPPPDAPRGSWPHLLVEVTDFVRLEKDVERDLIDAQDTTHHDKYNGKRSLDMVNLTVDTVLVVDESINNDFVTTYRPSRSASNETGPARGSTVTVTAAKGNGSGRNSPAPGAVTRGRAGQQQRSGRTRGCVGLQNLGNTCYMNSALQCVRSVEELTKYFLTHESEKEINMENPLSHNGDVARAYGRLLDEIYRDPAPSSVAPRNFKNTVGRYAPAFSGYGQQDSQEFLGWLLDGLQEDLNRIKKKPYIEKPDSTDDMIGNLAAIRAMADQVWDITKKRDDSVIADLFTGMYQSTLVCPVCSKVSITFDPFTNLTLPLPIASMWTNQKLRFYPLNDAPVELEVDLDKNTSIKGLRQFVSERVGVPVERLFVAEAFRNKFFKLYDDFSTVYEEIGSNDVPVVFELEAVPTNTPWSKEKLVKKKQKIRSMLNLGSEDDTPEPETPVWEEPASERIVVPVIHRVRMGDRFKKLAESNFIPASVIVLTVDEARNEDIIRRKVLEKVATFTTWKGFHDSESEEDSTDPEMLHTSSDGDSNVMAKSVESEDGLVDVKMVTDSDPHTAPSATTEYPKLLKKFNNKRPRWIDPRQFLPAEMQSLFEMSYFQGSTNIPCGWQEVSEDQEYPRLSSRQPKSSSDADMNSPSTVWEGSEGSETGGSAPVSPVSPQVSAQTRMADESSDNDSDIPAVKVRRSRYGAGISRRSNSLTTAQNVSISSRQPVAKIGGQRINRGKKGRPVTTYSRKANRKLAKQAKKEEKVSSSHYSQSVHSPDEDNTTPAPDDNGPLVRLGEGIVVDWSELAYDAVFGGDEPNEERGMGIWKHPAKLIDPSLQAARKYRESQRKQGISLDDCLKEFEKEEILSEQDTWYCPRCKEHRRASKKFDLWKTPDILAVHLKRFSSAGYRREKLDVLVDFPVEGLDLTHRVVDKGDGKSEIYDLIAVDDHWGGLGGGHYTAFAKNFIDGEWYEYNGKSYRSCSLIGPHSVHFS